MRKLYRNMAIVTSIFMLVMVVMMGVSYYQMQQVSPLQSEVMQTLKELNEANGENEALQQQVRQLDLLSRKAYFVKEGQLKVGLFILLAMAGVLVVSLNLYYRGTKTLPDKELDPVDEWMNKSRSRKYVDLVVYDRRSVGLFGSASLDDVEDIGSREVSLLADKFRLELRIVLDLGAKAGGLALMVEISSLDGG